MQLRILIFAIILVRSHAARNITTDVNAFISRFHELNDTSDVLDSFERLGDHSRELFRLGRPVGELLVRFNLSDEKNANDDLAAMDAVRELFDDPAVSACRKRSEARSFPTPDPIELLPYIDDDFGLTEFYTFTNCCPDRCYPPFITDKYMTRGRSSWKLARMSMKVRRVFDAMLMTLENENRTEIIKREHRNDDSDYDPLEMLRDLDDFISKDCSLMTKQDFSNYVQVQEAYRRSEERAEEVRRSGFWKYQKIDILTLSMEETPEELNGTVRIIDMSEPTAITLNMSSLYDYVDEKGIVRNMCHLKSINVVAEFNQTVVLSELRKIHSELMRLVLLQWATSSVVHPEEYERTTEKASQLLEHIGANVTAWIRDTQELAFPKIGIEATKTAIGKGPFLDQGLKEIADKAKRAFEEHGSQRYAYKVEVVPTGEIVKGITESENNYTCIADYGGIDIHVLRYRTSDSDGTAEMTKNFLKGEDGLSVRR